MYKGNSSRVLPIVLVLIVIAIAVAALVSVGRAIFSGGSATDTSQVDVGRDTLLSTASGNSVRMTVRGSIVADENFRSYRVVVTPASRSLTAYSGYLDETIKSVQFGNNVRAYEQFVYALDKANMMNGNVLEGDKNDTRGICATGSVYEFEVIKEGDVAKRLWTSTCKGSPGSFRASTQQVSSLFHEQIPNSKKVLKEIDL